MLNILRKLIIGSAILFLFCPNLYSESKFIIESGHLSEPVRFKIIKDDEVEHDAYLPANTTNLPIRFCVSGALCSYTFRLEVRTGDNVPIICQGTPMLVTPEFLTNKKIYTWKVSKSSNTSLSCTLE